MSRQDRVAGRVQPRGWFVIQEVELTGTAAISFANVPQSCVDIRVEGVLRGAAAAASAMHVVRFNSDSGANYDYEEVYGSGASAGAGFTAAGTYAPMGLIAHASATANIFSAFEIFIPGYRDSTHWKQYLARTQAFQAAGLNYVVQIGGQWRSTSAITQIALLGNAAGGTTTFVAGSRATLLGRK